jgi:hypothetical protein
MKQYIDKHYYCADKLFRRIHIDFSLQNNG